MRYKVKLEMNDNLPLRDVVFDALRKAILKGDLAPGERLMEIPLANQLGVSRTPVREAIRMLELEKLVVMMPRRGALVAGITEQGMKDVLEVRRALDVLCAELACKRISEEEIVELEKACKAFEEAALSDKSNIVEIAARDVAFHDIILKSTGNERLIQLVYNLSEQMYRYRFEYIKDSTNYEKLISEHRTIFTAIKDRDGETAARTAGLHIDNQVQAIMARIAIEKKETLTE